MIAFLHEIIRNIVIIVLLAGFMEMLAPKGEMARYIRLVMGLFIIVAILQPVMQILDTGFVLESISPGPITKENELQSILLGANQLSEQNQNLAARELKVQIERQIEAVTGLLEGVREAKAEVEFASAKPDFLEISLVKITVHIDEKGVNFVQKISQVQEVQIDLNNTGHQIFHQNDDKQMNTKKKEAISQKITQTVSNFFGIDRERIQVTIGTV